MCSGLTKNKALGSHARWLDRAWGGGATVSTAASHWPLAQGRALPLLPLPLHDVLLCTLRPSVLCFHFS